MKRPRLGAKVMRGLHSVYQLVDNAIEGGAELDEETEEEIAVALTYIRNLCVWYKARPRRDKT
jgi:hypothetical protein